jgi:hypothetical protein
VGKRTFRGSNFYFKLTKITSVSSCLRAFVRYITTLNQLQGLFAVKLYKRIAVCSKEL